MKTGPLPSTAKSHLSRTKTDPPTSVIRFLSSVIRFLSSVIRFLSSVICPLSSVICLLSSVICPLSSVLCHLSSVLCHLSSVICHLSSVICPMLSVFCRKLPQANTIKLILCLSSEQLLHAVFEFHATRGTIPCLPMFQCRPSADNQTFTCLLQIKLGLTGNVTRRLFLKCPYITDVPKILSKPIGCKMVNFCI
jgi:hypothetical protein